ncbi:hypothetical protein Enr13x_73070 [Stieleria neptunia]|uniref:Uncharacterized protein n=1 Tax=Stieleria neptunia TaxID=2527979 RepID=A0A518I2U4_9BACT|nr:hypothetical protein Enr13x_73070 [Stieleria neptunia]
MLRSVASPATPVASGFGQEAGASMTVCSQAGAREQGTCGQRTDVRRPFQVVVGSLADDGPEGPSYSKTGRPKLDGLESLDTNGDANQVPDDPSNGPME